MSIMVKLMPYRKREEVDWKKGMTVNNILEKFKWTTSPVHVLVNGVPATRDTELEEGDKVKLFLLPIVAGG